MAKSNLSDAIKNHLYNQGYYFPNDGENAVDFARKKYGKGKEDLPTTAAGDPKLKLPELVEQVDPQALSQVLPNMYKEMKIVRDLMNSFNSMNFGLPGSGGSSTNNTTPSAYAAQSITDVFTGALAILVKGYGYYYVLEELFRVLGNNNYKNILPSYQEIVFNAIINLIKKAAEYGETNIPVSTIPEITYGSSIPTPLLTSYSEVPNGYIQQYYSSSLDPYPGYIQYKGTNDDYVYVKRTTTDYPYISAEQETFTNAEYSFSGELSPYFRDKNLTVDILNELLVKYCTQIINNNLNKSAGKGNNGNFSSFAGLAGILSNLTQSSHLPQSVLDVASVAKSLENHKNNIGFSKKIKQHMAASVQLPGAINNLGMLNSLVSQLGSSFGGSSSQQKTIAAAQSIANNIIKTLA